MFPPTNLWLSAMRRSLDEVISPAIPASSALARIHVGMLSRQLASLAQQIDYLAAYQEIELDAALALARALVAAAEGGVETQEKSATLAKEVIRVDALDRQADPQGSAQALGFASEALIRASGLDGTQPFRTATISLGIADGRATVQREAARHVGGDAMRDLVLSAGRAKR